MNLEQRLEQVKKEFNAKIEEAFKAHAEEKAPDFKIGKWYKTDKAICFFKSEEEQFGINSLGEWVDPCYWMCREILMSTWTLATPEEVKEALVKEAEKRGFKVGVSFYSAHSSTPFSVNKGFTTHADYPGCLYAIGTDGEPHGVIFDVDSGKWAEIITTPKVMIGDKEVTRNGDLVTVDGTHYKREFLIELKVALSGQIKSLNVGCNGQYKVDLAKINEILAM